MEVFTETQDKKDLYGDRRSVFKRYEGFKRYLSLKHSEGVVKDIVPSGSKVLDYGCDHGSMGFLGNQNNVMVEGYDPYVNYPGIIYHQENDPLRVKQLLLV